MQTYPRQTRSKERGNVLFFIFLGIALFGALSFAVSDMMRGGSPETISQETAKLAAGEILDYGRTVRQAVQMVRINGCDETEINFDHANLTGYTNPGAPSDDSCDIFHKDGGGINVRATTTEDNQWMYKSGVEIDQLGTTCGTAACTELFAFVLVNSDLICDSINAKLGLPTDISGTIFPVVASSTITKFIGSYSFTGNLGSVTATEIRGKPTACIDNSTPGNPSVFYQVLMPR